MNTDDFVAMLATGVSPIKSGETRRRYAKALLWGCLGASLLMLALLGLRKDFAQAVYLPMFWFKLALPFSLACVALVGAIRLSRPGNSLGHVLPALAAPVVIAWLIAAGALMSVPADERLAMLLGQTWSVCPFLISLLSIPTFVATFWAMQGLAPTRPAQAGAAAGLLAGALATLIYALHCPEMAAPFLATWYLIGMLMPALAGAAIGARWLRW